MGTSRQRLDAIAKPDSFDDQKTAADIANSEAASEDLGQFKEAMLSQIKRIIHGDDAGNWHDDIATVFGQDASLKSLLSGVESIITTLLTDNNTHYVVIGDTTTDRKIEVDYSFELPVLNKSQVGIFTVNWDGSGVNSDHHFSFPGEQLDEVIFSADVNGTDIRMVIQNISLGENPTIKYRRTPIGLV